jgi:hypothetical protein
MMSMVLAGLAAALSLACAPQQADSLVVSDDPELVEIVTEILPELAERSGLELREPVRIARRSRAELQRYLEAQLEEELPAAEAAAVTESYHLLGMVPEGMDLRALLLSVYTEQVAGFYDPDSTALFVMNDQAPEALRTVLVHELVHAVQDQSANLDSLTARERGNDRQTAALAAIEGHATLVMFEYEMSQRMGRSIDLGEIPNFGTVVRAALQGMREQYPVLADAPRVVRESILFPYLEGTTFVQRLWQGADGRPSPLAELLPRSTEQVTLPEAGAEPRDEPTELRVTAARGQRYTNTLGAMETGILLEEVAGSAAAEAARGWDGDRFVLVDTPGGSALAWWSVWDDAAARDRFVAELTPGLGRLPRPARLVARELDGRPAALLEVGAPGEVTAAVLGESR